jgi:hypothetical protein
MSIIDRIRRNLELAKRCFGFGQLLGSPEPEYHICYKCGMAFNPDTAEYCDKCGVLLCPQGHCLCSLGLEAQVAVSREIESLGLWEYSPLYGKRKKRRKH